MSAFLGTFSFRKTDKMPVSGVLSAHVRSSPRRWKVEGGGAVSVFINKILLFWAVHSLELALPSVKWIRSWIYSMMI
jgi:hypothetical protein